MDKPGIGRRPPKPLEVEVFRKFNKHDKQFIEAKRTEFSHLLKPPPGEGAAGTGSVNWVGLNVDPCKAKFLVKKEALELMSADPIKAKFLAKNSLVTAGTRSLPNLEKDTSTTDKFRHRKLSKISAAVHFLEQKKGMNPLQADDARPDKLPLEEKLYSGVSRDSEGKAAYLKVRHGMWPRDKSRAPITSSQVVGWDCYKRPGKHIGKQLKPCEPPPSMIFIA